MFRCARLLFLRSPLRSEEHTSELQSLAYLVCRLLLEKKKLATNCVDPTIGCYPAAGGRGLCMRTEPCTPVCLQCAEPVNCALGRSCVSMTCVRLCAVA